jgi:hypothetical protein
MRSSYVVRIDVLTLPDLPQSMTIGQRPGVVFVPTRHRQVIVPPVLRPSPAARDGVVE